MQAGMRATGAGHCSSEKSSQWPALDELERPTKKLGGGSPPGGNGEGLS